MCILEKDKNGSETRTKFSLTSMENDDKES